MQIYASPSKDDAEEWARKLKRTKGVDAFISANRIRGTIWYRVRVGAYDTEEKAREAALKLGFAQSWIDRVR